METWWPWLAVAGLGALHGLSPATGWMFAAACGVHAGDRAGVRRALLPIAIGHAASIAVVACALVQGLPLDRALARDMAGALLVGAATCRLLRGTVPRTRVNAPVGHAGIALWCFLMTTAHGTGLMLVPALAPLCAGGDPALAVTASGSMVRALAAVGVHTATLLVTTGVIAAGVGRSIATHPRLSNAAWAGRAWTAGLAVTGVLLIALHS